MVIHSTLEILKVMHSNVTVTDSLSGEGMLVDDLPLRILLLYFFSLLAFCF